MVLERWRHLEGAGDAAVDGAVEMVGVVETADDHAAQVDGFDEYAQQCPCNTERTQCIEFLVF